MRRLRANRRGSSCCPRGKSSLFILAIVTCVFQSTSTSAEKNIVHWVKGKPLAGTATYANGTWKVGSTRMAPSELVAVQFTAAPPPQRVPSGVFLADGSILAGTLMSLRKGLITVKSLSLGRTLDGLKRDLLAGAFFPLSDGQPENQPFLKNYALLRANVIPSGLNPGRQDTSLPKPRRRNRITLHNLDAVDGALLWFRSRKALIDVPDRAPISLERKSIRLIECLTKPPTPPKKSVRSLGGEVAIRLKAGDVLRGRVLKLDTKELKLLTRFAGTIQLPRAMLAMLFPTGEKGSGLTWVSSLVPKKNAHVPYFDAQFPARANISCDGAMLTINGSRYDLGLGVHSKSTLTYALDAKPGRRFIAWVGIDDETRGRGSAVARVLLDGKERWKSGALTPNTPPKHVSVDLGKAKALTLLVDFGPDDDDSGDHVDWGWAAIVGR